MYIIIIQAVVRIKKKKKFQVTLQVSDASQSHAACFVIYIYPLELVAYKESTHS